MSDDNKRSVGEILNGIKDSLMNIGKDSVDLAKVGGERVQEMIDEQQKAKAASQAGDTEKKEASSEEVKGTSEEESEEKSEEVAEEKSEEETEDKSEEESEEKSEEKSEDKSE